MNSKKFSLIDSFKNLFKDSKKKKFLEESPKTSTKFHFEPAKHKKLYTVDNPPNKNIDDQYYKLIEYVNPEKLEHISKMQNDAYTLEKDAYHSECCICLVDKSNKQFFKCSHFVCTKCYQMLSGKNLHLCPICRQTIVVSKIFSNFALFASLGGSDIGIIYINPIETENKTKVYELFYNIKTSIKDRYKLQSAITQLVSKNYVIVFNDDVASDILASNLNIRFEKINNCK